MGIILKLKPSADSATTESNSESGSAGDTDPPGSSPVDYVPPVAGSSVCWLRLLSACGICITCVPPGPSLCSLKVGELYSKSLLLYHRIQMCVENIHNFFLL